MAVLVAEAVKIPLLAVLVRQAKVMLVVVEINPVLIIHLVVEVVQELLD